jgi:hypothetical protein
MPSEEMRGRQLPETPDVANAAIALSVACFFLLVLASMGLLFVYLKSSVPAAFRPPVERSFPAPRLQVAPRADLLDLEHAQRTELSGYAWVDREKGIARVPIDEAMRAVIARGDHAYDPPDPAGANSSGANGANQ